MTDTSSTTNTGSFDASVRITSGADGSARDQVLSDIRSGRRLDKIVTSVQSFLENQVSRLEHAIQQCEAAVDNDRYVREKMERFEKEKRDWDAGRIQELARLKKAGDELAKAWEKLDAEKKAWTESRNSTS